MSKPSPSKFWSKKCGKMSYASHAVAMAKNRAREEETNYGWIGKVYLCSKCNLWHRATYKNNKVLAEEKRVKERREAALAAERKKAKATRAAAKKRFEDEQRAKAKKAYEEAASVRKMIAEMEAREHGTWGATPKKKRKSRRSGSSTGPTSWTSMSSTDSSHSELVGA